MSVYRKRAYEAPTVVLLLDPRSRKHAWRFTWWEWFRVRWQMPRAKTDEAYRGRLFAVYRRFADRARAEARMEAES